MGRPSIFYTGVTKYDPQKCWNGFTVVPARGYGAMLINMNGKVVHLWENLQGEPNRVLKGGYIMSSRGVRDKYISHQDRIDLIMADWDGQIKWKFNHGEFCEDEGREPQWMLRQHHDYQISGNPVGYYSPESDLLHDFKKVLILRHKDVIKERISNQILEDDVLTEIDREGNVVWEWSCTDHFNEFGFSEIQKNSIYRNPNIIDSGLKGQGDLFHINSASYVGPNKWFDSGDMRFCPENIIMCSRETNIIFIIEKKTGKIVWKIGPDYTILKELRMLGIIIGCHNAHIIPKGLPGEGNLLVYDNGGWAGYGLPDQLSKTGNLSCHRDYSRVLEFDPTTLEIKWELNPHKLGFNNTFNEHYFYSPLVSNAQRLPNGNTLITEGTDGRIFEITKDFEIVWDFYSPYYDKANINMIYRSYRIPYDYVPQAKPGEMESIIPVDSKKLRLKNADNGLIDETVKSSVDGTWEFGKTDSFCVEKL